MKKTGQVTLLVLLLGLLGLTVALSSVSRSLSDIHQASQTDSGSKALAAAEAMAEYAIAQGTGLCEPTYPAGLPVLSGIQTNAGGNQGMGYSVCTLTRTYFDVDGVSTNDVVSVDLQQIPNATPKTLNILWGGNSSIEVSYIDRSTPPVLARYAANELGSSKANKFSSATDPNDPTTGCFDAISNNCPTSSKYTNCLSIDRPLGQPLNQGRLARIRTLYSSTDIRVCIASQAGPGHAMDLGAQSVNYVGIARALDGTTRRVQLAKTGSSLPGIFDYSIYSEGDLSK